MIRVVEGDTRNQDYSSYGNSAAVGETMLGMKTWGLRLPLRCGQASLRSPLRIYVDLILAEDPDLPESRIGRVSTKISSE